MNSEYHFYVRLSARIHFEVVCELATEARHFDRLPRAESAYINARRSADEDVDFARTIVDHDDEPERQIVNDGLSDRSRNPDDAAFAPFTHVAGCDWNWLHFRSTSMSFD